MRSRRAWALLVFLFVAGDAIALQSRGALLANFEADFGVSASLLGLVAPAGTLGFVLAVLVVGLVAGRVDARRVMLVGTAATVCSLVVLASAPVYALFLLALLGQGTAAGVFRGIDRAVLSHLYPRRRGRIFTLYSLAWALGAVVGPLGVSAVLTVADWRVTYLLLAAWFLPLVAVTGRLSAPDRVGNEQGLSRTVLRRLLGHPTVAGAIAAMALAGGIEGAIFTWLPYYAGTFLVRDLANAALSVYLLAYVPGRLGYTALVERLPYLTLLAGIALLSVPALAVALGGTTGVAMLGAAFVAGLLVSGLFPVLSAFGVDAAPAYSGPISALTTGATYVGIAVVPTVMGVVADVADIRTAMWIPVYLAVALVAVIAVLWYGTDTERTLATAPE